MDDDFLLGWPDAGEWVLEWFDIHTERNITVHLRLNTLQVFVLIVRRSLTDMPIAGIRPNP